MIPEMVSRKRGVEAMGKEPVPVQDRFGLGLSGLGMPAEKVVVLGAGLPLAVVMANDVEVHLGQGDVEQPRDHQSDPKPPRRNRQRPMNHGLAPSSILGYWTPAPRWFPLLWRCSTGRSSRPAATGAAAFSF